MISRLCAVVACAVLVGACGYRPVASAGREGTICVPIAENRTAFDGLDGELTGQVRLQLAARGVDVSTCGGGADRLTIEVLEVNGSPGVTAAAGELVTPVTTIWKLRIQVELRSSRGDRKMGPWIFDEDASAYGGDSPLAEEELGRRARDRIASSLASRIVTAVLQ